MKQVMIKDLKEGDFFTLEEYGDLVHPPKDRVYIRDHAFSKRLFVCLRLSDLSDGSLFLGDHLVWTGFSICEV